MNAIAPIVKRLKLGVKASDILLFGIALGVNFRDFNHKVAI